mmetsp:Transcript_121124/g.338053  ORF Transcript_121124/g.338053 Transcript_121124/m.338053 type:complete len:240 (-) Transcript_121124:167-886(-)
MRTLSPKLASMYGVGAHVPSPSKQAVGRGLLPGSTSVWKCSRIALIKELLPVPEFPRMPTFTKRSSLASSSKLSRTPVTKACMYSGMGYCRFSSSHLCSLSACTRSRSCWRACFTFSSAAKRSSSSWRAAASASATRRACSSSRRRAAAACSWRARSSAAAACRRCSSKRLAACSASALRWRWASSSRCWYLSCSSRALCSARCCASRCSLNIFSLARRCSSSCLRVSSACARATRAAS